MFKTRRNTSSMSREEGSRRMILTGLPSAQFLVLPLRILARSAVLTLPVEFCLSATMASCLACARQENNAIHASSEMMRDFVTMLSIVGRAGVPQKGTEVTRRGWEPPSVTLVSGLFGCGLGCWLWFGGSSLLYARKFLRHQTTNAEQTAVGAHIGGGLTRGRISLASGQHNRGLAEALQLDAAGRGIGRQHGGGSGYRRSIVFNRYLQKVLRIADAQDQRFHHQLSIHAERILHGGKQSLYGKLAAGANPERRSRFGGEARTRACLHESRLIRERGASARYLEIVSKQGLLRNSG